MSELTATNLILLCLVGQNIVIIFFLRDILGALG